MSEGGVAQRALRHELRTPLNQIIGYGELLDEELTDSGDERAADARRIVVAARQLLQLIEIAVPDTAAHLSQIGRAARAEGGVSPDRALSEFAGSEILVVDDIAENREMLARRLATRGFVVTVAPGGEEALELIEHRAFHLALLDVEMPGLSGLDVLRMARTRYSRADLPVIMATGRDASDDMVIALEAGANDYVTKPLDFPVVLARVEGQLALKQARDEAVRLASELEVANRFIRSTFGRFVSDEVATRVLESPDGLELGGESRELTVLTCDIRGFSSLAEQLDPRSTVTLLNVYLSAMADVLLAHHGTIDEFIGDGILAIFGAPLSSEDHARQALECAVEMQLAMAAVNERNRTLGLPEIEIGIAVNSGRGTVGNIGSKTRTKYGVVGPIINVAARIEAATVGGQILTAEATLQAAGADVLTGAAQSLTMKGARAPLTVHEVRGVGDRRLEHRDEPIVELPRPLAVVVTIVGETKLLGTERFKGTITAASSVAARLTLAEATLAPLEGIRVRFPRTTGELYARVVTVDDDGTYTVRFAASTASAAALLRHLRSPVL